MISSREMALKILYDIEYNNAYSNIELNKKLGDNEISSQEKALATELVYGVTKWKVKLDWIISRLSKIKLDKISPWVINILRIGIYQLDFLERIPTSAAVNECVKLAKKYSHTGSVSFVNGLLRNYLRDKDKVDYPDKSNIVKYISVMYSHPEWLVEKWVKDYGSDFTVKLCLSNNNIPPLSCRVNTLKSSKTELLESLKTEGINTENGIYFDEAFFISSHVNISNLNTFKNGLFQIQDESSMMTAHILNPKPGQTVLDVCAAPGGKSTHLAELMNNNGKVISRDIHEHKIKLINENCKRLGISIIESEVFDAVQIDTTLIDMCDCVLVDAPCSGLGIIRRKPEIKYNRSTQDADSLAQLQKRILSVSAEYVKKHGTLVYSTCTLNDEENWSVVKDFIINNSEFSLVEISSHLPNSLIKATCSNGYIQTYPHIDNIDGFFVAKMIRN